MSIRDDLAKHIHNEMWAGWMQYLFSKGKFTADGFVIPQSLVIRWVRQMCTDYEALPDNEKTSDLEEADQIIDLVKCK